MSAHTHDHDHASRPDGWSLSSDEELRRGARILAAIGDVERLRLLQLIAPGELCVSELVELSDAKPTTVSQRLRLLRDHDLVRTRREGKHVYYRLADDHVIALLRSAIEHAVEAD
ncbi:hypothetical protein BH23ACT9_BH23ACT9_22620 [soil metagenome]